MEFVGKVVRIIGHDIDSGTVVVTVVGRYSGPDSANDDAERSYKCTFRSVSAC